MRGEPGQGTRPHGRLRPTFLGEDAWMTYNWTYFLFASYVGHWCRSYFFGNVIHGCLYNQAMTDIRSTGAGIKCLYCRNYQHAFVNVRMATIKLCLRGLPWWSSDLRHFNWLFVGSFHWLGFEPHLGQMCSMSKPCNAKSPQI